MLKLNFSDDSGHPADRMVLPHWFELVTLPPTDHLQDYANAEVSSQSLE
jgi:hypothetical protein